MKNRANKIKRLHTIIEGLEKYLIENIAPITFVTGIIPGRIKKTRGSSHKLKFEIQYKTKAGMKCIAKSGGSVQEVFIIINSHERIEELIAVISQKSVTLLH